MKYLLVLLLLTSCVFSQNLAISWDYPYDVQVQDSLVFNIYVWHGDAADTAAFDSTQLTPIALGIPYNQGQTDYTIRHTFTQRKFIRIGATAENRLGRVSDFSYNDYFIGWPYKAQRLKLNK